MGKTAVNNQTQDNVYDVIVVGGGSAGVAAELFEGCKALDGYVGCIFDWRTLWGVCVARDLPISNLQEQLTAQGAILDGTR